MRKKIETTVSILGTIYRVFLATRAECPRLTHDAMMDDTVKEIAIRELDPDEAKDPALVKNYGARQKEMAAHELTHAFFAEAGISSVGRTYDEEWICDWLGVALPKIHKAYADIFRELEVGETAI